MEKKNCICTKDTSMTSSLSFLSAYINWVWLINDTVIGSILVQQDALIVYQPVTHITL